MKRVTFSEITESDNIIAWYRGYTGAYIVFRPKNDGEIITIKRYNFSINRRWLSRTYFILTDEEVERMIIPRII